MDGVELVAAIRALESEEGLARTPVVALAANVMEGEREHCVWAGMDDYIGKPTTIPFLASKLRRWLPQLASPHGSRSSRHQLLLPRQTACSSGRAERADRRRHALADELLDDFVQESRSDLASLRGVC